MARKTAEELASEISDFINVASPNEMKELALRITRDHRTLQQDTFKVMLDCVEIWAENYKQNSYDARNEYTCRASHEMIEELKIKDLF